MATPKKKVASKTVKKTGASVARKATAPAKVVKTAAKKSTKR